MTIRYINADYIYQDRDKMIRGVESSASQHLLHNFRPRHRYILIRLMRDRDAEMDDMEMEMGMGMGMGGTNHHHHSYSSAKIDV